MSFRHPLSRGEEGLGVRKGPHRRLMGLPPLRDSYYGKVTGRGDVSVSTSVAVVPNFKNKNKKGVKININAPLKKEKKRNVHLVLV